MRQFAIDLFCGAGGMTCGLIQAGYTVVAGVDKEERCRETYTQNKNISGSPVEFLNLDLFPYTPDHPDGEQGLAVKKLKKILKRHDFYKTRGDKLLLAICAPCQPFTKITKIKLSKQRAFNQSRDKNLLLASLNIIKALKPDAILCENVEGIVGEDRVLKKFSQQLDALNYSFSTSIINTKKFGVPQKRKRTICLGYNRKKISKPPLIPHSDEKSNYATVKETIDHLPPLIAGESHASIKNHKTRALSDLNLKRISCASPGESNAYLKNTPYGDLMLTCHRKLKGSSFRDTYTRMVGDQASPTITTKFSSITNGRFGHYDIQQNRGLSIKEGALLQTFPDDYIFYPEDNMQFPAILIGNAVPPKIAKFFGNHISQSLQS